MTTRSQILVRGIVQGVGFRYTIQRYAAGSGLKGWVQNLSDGRVEVVVEGSKEKIDEMCQKIETHFHGYIRGQEQEFEESPGEFKDFQIRV